MSDREDQWEVFRLAIKRIEQQRTTEREKVRAAMKAAVVPLPNEVVVRLVQLNHENVREVLVDHPGYKAWERLESYRISLRVFERTVPDLITVIELFEAAVEDDILSRKHQDKLHDIELAFQKELFATTNAAHSLVDHSTRRLQKVVNIPGYKAKLTDCFGNDGLHEFVIGLRTVLHHLHMIQAGRQIQYFEKGKKAKFTLKRDRMCFVFEQMSDSFGKTTLEHILAYLSELPETIDLKLVFEDYQRRANDFHTWFSGELASDSLIEIRDYERCLQESVKFSTCTFWKAMLGNWLNWKEPPNPYNYLPNYLTPEEIKEIYGLVMQSDEQIDKVIEFMDTERACDVDLRRMIYELFRRATSPALTPNDVNLNGRSI